MSKRYRTFKAMVWDRWAMCDREVQFEYGASNPLIFSWAYLYRWHVVAALHELLPLKQFSHISLDAAAAALGPYEVQVEEPLRLSKQEVFQKWGKKFGLLCGECGRIQDTTRQSIWEAGCKQCGFDMSRREKAKAMAAQRAAEQEKIDRRFRIARLENEVADLSNIFKNLKRKTDDRFNRHRRRSRQDAGVLEKT